MPVADYHSIENGRIEGVGVKPDILVSAEQALEVALGR
jgi:C-terminal processing protease CtpA/Prc